MPTIDLLRQVYLDERVWADARSPHKMGWIRPGNIVHLIEEYQGWYRIDPGQSTVPELRPAHNSDGSAGPPWDYNEWWVQDNPSGLFGPVEEDEDDDPIPDPEPVDFDDEELGAAVRVVLQAVGKFVFGNS